jgi:hypothetical protein
MTEVQLLHQVVQSKRILLLVANACGKLLQAPCHASLQVVLPAHHQFRGRGRRW